VVLYFSALLQRRRGQTRPPTKPASLRSSVYQAAVELPCITLDPVVLQ
jgi:hypothetical protein